MDKEIRLEFKDKTLTCISGNSYGVSVFNDQVKQYFDGKTRIKVIFPKEIVLVSISFTQGFISWAVKKYGKDTALSLLEFEAGNTKLTQKIEEDARF